MVIRPGEQWGVPWTGGPKLTVEGGTAELAAIVAASPDIPIAWNSTADDPLARAVGLRPWRGGEPGWSYELPMDALVFSDGRISLNLIVVGTAPDRLRRWTRSWPLEVVSANGVPDAVEPATTVVIANGQFCGTLDVVPRGHPGDGRAEVHTYRVRRGDRPKLRRRLLSGTHIPHPEIEQRSVRTFGLRCPSGVALEIDGAAAGTITDLQVTVHHGAYRLLV